MHVDFTHTNIVYILKKLREVVCELAASFLAYIHCKNYSGVKIHVLTVPEDCNLGILCIAVPQTLAVNKQGKDTSRCAWLPSKYLAFFCFFSPWLGVNVWKG